MRISNEKFMAALTASPENAADLYESEYFIAVIGSNSTKRHIADDYGTLCGKGHSSSLWRGDRIKSAMDCDCADCTSLIDE